MTVKIDWINPPVDTPTFNIMSRWCKVPHYLASGRDFPAVLLEGTLENARLRRKGKAIVRTSKDGRLLIDTPIGLPPIHLDTPLVWGCLSYGHLIAETHWRSPITDEEGHYLHGFGRCCPKGGI